MRSKPIKINEKLCNNYIFLYHSSSKAARCVNIGLSLHHFIITFVSNKLGKVTNSICQKGKDKKKLQIEKFKLYFF